ncbi:MULTISPECIES: amino acid ABC transporter permease [Clostridium]|uniref:amino acid ABC transporter permease n=1 Tax=Clostridium TaxID=1485 RepID=UPI000823FDDC|nr:MULTISPECIES: amino acid ABC transporter permease [Clostridium]PJI08482.1 amino acid ABC transporter permease [Clostridium sp. CT7]
MDIVLPEIPYLLKAAYYTVILTVVSVGLGLIIGLIAAIARLTKNNVISSISRIYVSIIRGTPALVQIFIIYYGLPDWGITLSPLTAAFVALSINVGAYLSETIRGAILSVPKGQMEAAKALGMTYFQSMTRIILPQAAKIAIAPIGNTFIGMLKDTSLVSIITVTELLRAAQLLIAKHLTVMPFYIAVAIIYWIMSTFFSFILGRIESRLSKSYSM